MKDPPDFFLRNRADPFLSGALRFDLVADKNRRRQGDRGENAGDQVGSRVVAAIFHGDGEAGADQPGNAEHQVHDAVVFGVIAFCADERTLVRLSADTRRYERTNMNCLACDGTRTV